MPFFRADEELNALGNRILEATWEKFTDLPRNKIALTWLVYDPPFPTNTGGALDAQTFWQYPVRGFSYRGMERIYPASIVKLFYLVACHEWLETGMLPPSTELQDSQLLDPSGFGYFWILQDLDIFCIFFRGELLLESAFCWRPH